MSLSQEQPSGPGTAHLQEGGHSHGCTPEQYQVYEEGSGLRQGDPGLSGAWPCPLVRDMSQHWHVPMPIGYCHNATVLCNAHNALGKCHRLIPTSLALPRTGRSLRPCSFVLGPCITIASSRLPLREPSHLSSSFRVSCLKQDNSLASSQTHHKPRTHSKPTQGLNGRETRLKSALSLSGVNGDNDDKKWQDAVALEVPLGPCFMAPFPVSGQEAPSRPAQR